MHKIFIYGIFMCYVKNMETFRGKVNNKWSRYLVYWIWLAICATLESCDSNYPDNWYKVEMNSTKTWYVVKRKMWFEHYEGGGNKSYNSYKISMDVSGDKYIVRVNWATNEVENFEQVKNFVVEQIKTEEWQQTSPTLIYSATQSLLGEAHGGYEFAAEDSLVDFEVIENDDYYDVHIVFKDWTTIKTIKNWLFSRLEKLLNASIKESSISLDGRNLTLILNRNSGSNVEEVKNK